MKIYTISFIILIIFVLLISGCINMGKVVYNLELEKEEKEAPKTDNVKDLLKLPSDDLFFSALADGRGADPDNTEQLLEAYKEKQERLFLFALENKNYSASWFFYNNLLAFDSSGLQNKEGFFNCLIQGYEQNGYIATSRYLSLIRGKRIDEEESPFKSVTSFQDILVEIYVNRTYEDKYKLKRKDNSFGSGFLINDTQIVTAFHIVESCFAVDTKSFLIYIKKGDKIAKKVKITAWDSLTDIALLETEDEEFDISIDFISMIGNSNTLAQGDDIYCLGHHSGLTSTLTKGIVSATERRAPEVGTWIQIDANISPGASGGIAIGKDKKIYGMIVAGIVFEDLNFIVPSNLILSVLDQLRHGEQIRRPWTGLLLEEYWNVKGNITITDVFPTSPLHMYNIKRGDKLLEINHQPVENIKSAQDIINELFAGNLVHMKIGHDSEETDCWVLLERRPDYPIYNATIDYNKISSLYPHFGFEVEDENIMEQNFTFQGKTFQLNLYPVKKIQRFSVLDNKGVRIGDYIGFLSDYFINKTRYIEVLHIPQDKKIQEMEDFDIYDFIYRMVKGAYDENIL